MLENNLPMYLLYIFTLSKHAGLHHHVPWADGKAHVVAINQIPIRIQELQEKFLPKVLYVTLMIP